MHSQIPCCTLCTYSGSTVRLSIVHPFRETFDPKFSSMLAGSTRLGWVLPLMCWVYEQKHSFRFESVLCVAAALLLGIVVVGLMFRRVFTQALSVRSLNSLASRTPMKRISRQSLKQTTQPTNQQTTIYPMQPNSPPTNLTARRQTVSHLGRPKPMLLWSRSQSQRPRSSVS